MKNFKSISSIIMFFIIVGIESISNAGVEIKEKGTPLYANVNISESFDICYNLRDSSSTLGTNGLDPHMATSLDWGAVAYLAQSRYGANSSNVTNNTTGNASGIRDLGSYTQTATIFEDRNKVSANATNYRYKLEEAVLNPNLSKYVDVISNTVDNTTSKGRAMTETKNWYGANTSWTSINGKNTDNPIIIRDSLFGVVSNYFVVGQAHSQLSFRPVIWN